MNTLLPAGREMSFPVPEPGATVVNPPFEREIRIARGSLVRVVSNEYPISIDQGIGEPLALGERENG